MGYINVIDLCVSPENKKLHTNVCIIGGGVAGITIAGEFINIVFKVCLLEGGGLERESQSWNIYRGESTGHPYFKLDETRTPCLGGTSHQWHINLNGRKQKNHGVSNLFIAGSSVFPTTDYVNPAFTIVALAIRFADHIRYLIRKSDGIKIIGKLLIRL